MAGEPPSGRGTAWQTQRPRNSRLAPNSSRLAYPRPKPYFAMHHTAFAASRRPIFFPAS